jgi:hypothetical protein
MLRAGRITPEDVNGVLQALPDLEGECEDVPLAQPALDVAAAPSSPARPVLHVSGSTEASGEAPDDDDEAEA